MIIPYLFDFNNNDLIQGPYSKKIGRVSASCKWSIEDYTYLSNKYSDNSELREWFNNRNVYVSSWDITTFRQAVREQNINNIPAGCQMLFFQSGFLAQPQFFVTSSTVTFSFWGELYTATGYSSLLIKPYINVTLSFENIKPTQGSSQYIALIEQHSKHISFTYGDVTTDAVITYTYNNSLNLTYEITVGSPLIAVIESQSVNISNCSLYSYRPSKFIFLNTDNSIDNFNYDGYESIYSQNNFKFYYKNVPFDTWDFTNICVVQPELWDFTNFDDMTSPFFYSNVYPIVKLVNSSGTEYVYLEPNTRYDISEWSDYDQNRSAILSLSGNYYLKNSENIFKKNSIGFETVSKKQNLPAEGLNGLRKTINRYYKTDSDGSGRMILYSPANDNFYTCSEKTDKYEWGYLDDSVSTNGSISGIKYTNLKTDSKDDFYSVLFENMTENKNMISIAHWITFNMFLIEDKVIFLDYNSDVLIIKKVVSITGTQSENKFILSCHQQGEAGAESSFYIPVWPDRAYPVIRLSGSKGYTPKINYSLTYCKNFLSGSYSSFPSNKQHNKIYYNNAQETSYELWANMSGGELGYFTYGFMPYQNDNDFKEPFPWCIDLSDVSEIGGQNSYIAPGDEHYVSDNPFDKNNMHFYISGSGSNNYYRDFYLKKDITGCGRLPSFSRIIGQKHNPADDVWISSGSYDFGINYRNVNGYLNLRFNCNCNDTGYCIVVVPRNSV